MTDLTADDIEIFKDVDNTQWYLKIGMDNYDDSTSLKNQILEWQKFYEKYEPYIHHEQINSIIKTTNLKELKDKAEKWDYYKTGGNHNCGTYGCKICDTKELEAQVKSLQEALEKRIDGYITDREDKNKEIVSKIREYIKSNEGFLLAHDEIKEILGGES